MENSFLSSCLLLLIKKTFKIRIERKDFTQGQIPLFQSCFLIKKEPEIKMAERFLLEVNNFILILISIKQQSPVVQN